MRCREAGQGLVVTSKAALLAICDHRREQNARKTTATAFGKKWIWCSECAGYAAMKAGEIAVPVGVELRPLVAEREGVEMSRYGFLKAGAPLQTMRMKDLREHLARQPMKNKTTGQCPVCLETGKSFAYGICYHCQYAAQKAGGVGPRGQGVGLDLLDALAARAGERVAAEPQPDPAPQAEPLAEQPAPAEDVAGGTGRPDAPGGLDLWGELEAATIAAERALAAVYRLRKALLVAGVE